MAYTDTEINLIISVVVFTHLLFGSILVLYIFACIFYLSWGIIRSILKRIYPDRYVTGMDAFSDDFKEDMEKMMSDLDTMAKVVKDIARSKDKGDGA